MRRGRMARVSASIVVLAALAVAATIGWGLAERLIHPARYATSGRARIELDAYVVAAAHALTPEERIVRLTLPRGDGPVIVSSPSIDVYLDPPTARVLDRSVHARAVGASPARAAQSIASVVARAMPYGGGGALVGVAWPTERTPDWTVAFVGAAVKVADDSGTARAAPARPSGGAALAGRLPDGSGLSLAARVAIVLVAIGVAGVFAWGLFTRPSRKARSVP